MKYKAACVMGPAYFSELAVGFIQLGISTVKANTAALEELLAGEQIHFIFADNRFLDVDSIRKVRKEHPYLPIVVFGNAKDDYILEIKKQGCQYLHPYLEIKADELMALAALPMDGY